MYEELFGEALPDEEFVPSLCFEEPELNISLISHGPDDSGCRNPAAIEAACAMAAFVYSMDAVDVDVFMVEVAVTESGVASLGGVGGKLNIGCDDELE